MIGILKSVLSNSASSTSENIDDWVLNLTKFEVNANFIHIGADIFQLSNVTGFGLDYVPVEEPGGCLFVIFSLFGMKRENIKMKSALIIYLNSSQKRALLAEESAVVAIMKLIYINMREGGRNFKIDLRNAQLFEITGNEFDASEVNIGVSGKKGKS